VTRGFVPCVHPPRKAPESGSGRPPNGRLVELIAFYPTETSGRPEPIERFLESSSGIAENPGVRRMLLLALALARGTVRRRFLSPSSGPAVSPPKMVELALRAFGPRPPLRALSEILRHTSNPWSHVAFRASGRGLVERDIPVRMQAISLSPRDGYLAVIEHQRDPDPIRPARDNRENRSGAPAQSSPRSWPTPSDPGARSPSSWSCARSLQIPSILTRSFH